MMFHKRVNMFRYDSAIGEAYLELYSVEETEKSKKYNRKFLGQRFVVIEEITEEQFLLVKLDHIRNPQ